MASYSGDWILVPEESDNLNEVMRRSTREGGDLGGMAGGRPGGGGRRPGGGGMPGGGSGRGGRGGMAGGDMDPEEMRLAMEAIQDMAQVPPEITLTLRPEEVTLVEKAGKVLRLALGGTEENILQGETTLIGTASWTKDGIEIKRELERVGIGVRDRISVTEAGQLVLKREVELMGRSVRGTLVFQRKPYPV